MLRTLAITILHAIINKKSVTLLDKADQIQKLTETEPLTVDHIKKLSPHRPKYVIPYNQQKSKRYGLIMFNSDNRPNAAEEVQTLELALTAAGFIVQISQWSNARELLKEIKKALRCAAADCSMLFVCLMSHGSRGELAGSTGAPIAMNKVLQQLSDLLPTFLPLVSRSFHQNVLVLLATANDTQCARVKKTWPKSKNLKLLKSIDFNIKYQNM